MPEKTRTSAVRALMPLTVAAALVLSGCDAGEEGTDVTAATITPTPTPSTVQGVQLTEPGTRLRFGDFATVEHDAKGGRSDVLKLRVDSAEQGRIEDFAGFDLDDPYKRQGSYYYVRVTVKNAGKHKTGSIPVPLWGISGRDTLLRAVDFTSSFKRCPTEDVPHGFKPGATFRTCLVYLSPEHGSLEGVSYRPTEQFVPIVWHGTVKEPPGSKRGGKQGPKKPKPQGKG